MSALRCLVCSACHVAYVWRVTWRPVEKRMEWRPSPDCACNDAFGMPAGRLFVRDECVTGTDTAHASPEPMDAVTSDGD